MDFLEELSQTRQKWVDASRDNAFEEGLKHLLTELYPDNAHFIFELLQNAEDTGATSVSFDLTPNGLRIVHNGTRLFTNDDVTSITSIGASSKKDDLNQIGKFGIGFKAVFSYTNTPQVNSGKFVFEIRDLVRPVALTEVPPVLSGSRNETVFWFPFNHAAKTPELATQEISAVLKKLPDTTLLFLRNIRRVSWTSPDSTGTVEKSRTSIPEIVRIATDNERERVSWWLKFSKRLPELPRLSVEIAFRLKQDLRKSDTYRIDPDRGNGGVSIFFPAEKETSNLGFQLHAPFAATIARDSIQNRPENLSLRDLLVELLVESLTKIKRLKLLDRDFLEVLPNNRDELSEFYTPFRDAVLDAFRKQKLTPTSRSGFYDKADNLSHTSREIRSVINKESILDALTDGERTDWVISAQKGTRTYDFIQSLAIKDWDISELVERISDRFSDTTRASKVLSKQTDRWMQRFYALLGKAIDDLNYYEKRQLEDAAIVRRENGKHSIGEGVFFQTNLVSTSKKVALAKRGVYQTTKEGKPNARAVSFLEAVGVKNFEPSDEIKIILNKFYTRGEPNFLQVKDSDHLSHIRKFVKFLDSTPEKREMFADCYILRVEDEDNSPTFALPTNVAVDLPFHATQLGQVTNLLGLSGLWPGYIKLCSQLSSFPDFLRRLNAVFELPIIETYVTNNPYESELKFDVLRGSRETAHAIDDDYDITNLKALIEASNREVSRLIWDRMRRAEKRVLLARYRANATSQIRTQPSKLVCTLRDYAWVPDSTGQFRTPAEMSPTELPADFPFDNRNGWLEAIGFGTSPLPSVNSKERLRLLKQLNLKTLDELDRALEFARLSAEDRMAFEDFRKSRKPRGLNQPGQMDQGNPIELEPPTEIGNKVGSDEPRSDALDLSNNGQSSRQNGLDYEPANAESLQYEDIREHRADDEEENKILNKGLGPVQTTQLVDARLGQGTFRRNLERVELGCRLTGIRSPLFLIGSHIKPWRESTTAEKLDGNNGLLLAPHVDRLFDRGWISFSDSGDILVANDEVRFVMEMWGLDPSACVGPFNESQRQYLDFHRQNRFKGQKE